MSESPIYKISLPQFEGPFDLLLFFIERDELDIQDIPIYKITQDFLDYIKALEEMNIEVASEFILVAATLMKIKTKMLLPRKEINEEGEEIDPREELVQKLLEYKQYKAVLESLKEMEENRSLHVSRGSLKEEVQEIMNLYDYDAQLEPVSLFRLFKSFHRVIENMNERKNRIEHQVIPYHYTLEEEKDKLFQRLTSAKKSRFEEIFEECKTKIHAVFIFLAMLELIQQQKLSIQVGDGYNNLWLEA